MAPNFRFDDFSVLFNTNELLELVPKAEPVKTRREPPRSVKDAYPSLDDEAYWLEQSDARYHSGLTAERLESRENAIQRVKKRIKKRRANFARSPCGGAAIEAKLKGDAMRRLQVLSLEMPIHTSGFLSFSEQYWYEPVALAKPVSSLTRESSENYWYEDPKDSENHVGTTVEQKLTKDAAIQRLSEVGRLQSLCRNVYKCGQKDESVFSGASISRTLKYEASRALKANASVGASYWDE